ncbi:unnamed protein product [Cylicocyclus nassatus]|uniref:Uncharacterized protein n=1 Tax=Cylicocyclus nassatus TaxID=53992 RepID=A0AA36M780_CYLNA|nr:unnamed protein product [Cylicocyclus nassatus]
MNIMRYATVLLYFIALQIHKLEANFPEDVIEWVRNTIPVIQTPVYAASAMNEMTWHCGSKTYKISITVSKFVAEWWCAKIKDKINKACKKHDRCYEKQRGRTYCDRVFCDRLDELEDKYLSTPNLCPTTLMCKAVVYWGEKAYEASRHKLF